MMMSPMLEIIERIQKNQYLLLLLKRVSYKNE